MQARCSEGSTTAVTSQHESPARIRQVVEQTSAERDGFPRSLIDGPDNLVRISTYKHWEINAWYQTKNERFNDLSPRDYLRGASWDVRMRIGLEALVDAGVLQP